MSFNLIIFFNDVDNTLLERFIKSLIYKFRIFLTVSMKLIHIGHYPVLSFPNIGSTELRAAAAPKILLWLGP